MTGVLLDVQKAFDSVNHNMLCQKINLVGIDPEWFRSYLSNRTQVVSANGVVSSELVIKAGVPQGSLLGPWCYVIYSVKNKLILYAGDAIVLVSNRNINLVADILGLELSNCFHWLTNNQLAMHMGKTEVIILTSKHKRNLVKNLVVKCHETTVSISSEVKYLGIKLDATLSGNSMVSPIVSKSMARL